MQLRGVTEGGLHGTQSNEIDSQSFCALKFLFVVTGSATPIDSRAGVQGSQLSSGQMNAICLKRLRKRYIFIDQYGSLITSGQLQCSPAEMFQLVV